MNENDSGDKTLQVVSFLAAAQPACRERKEDGCVCVLGEAPNSDHLKPLLLISNHKKSAFDKWLLFTSSPFLKLL